MTKAELCKKISDQTGCDMQSVSAIVESLMVSVKGSLEKGENVYLRGFGSFILRRRAEKTARNISKNTTVIVPAHDIPAFKPAKEFTDLISKLKD
ncbi:DNA-binding protein HU [gut metagenome]|uniref:DNA-binding protein HU n=1 Tax=gut metagenome TaxID=749906 RepID=J9C600_9ZZZZ